MNDSLPEPIVKPRKIPIRQVALQALVNNGTHLKDAAALLGYTYGTARSLASREDMKNVNKWKFKDDSSSQKIAYKTIKALAAGKIPAHSNIESIKDSTALEASKHIRSFHESSKAEEAAASTAAQFTQVNINVELINGFPQSGGEQPDLRVIEVSSGSKPSNIPPLLEEGKEAC